MYRIFNFLFGWDYVYWQNICSNGIARVYKSPDGYAWFYRYRITGLIDRVSSYPAGSFIFLTCKSDKYK